MKRLARLALACECLSPIRPSVGFLCKHQSILRQAFANHPYVCASLVSLEHWWRIDVKKKFTKMSGERWSTDDILRFIEVYQGEPCIWNPKEKEHKDKKKVADAWNRVSEILKIYVKDLKNKKEILMVTFRKHLKKKQESIRSGAGAGEIYESTWFAYELMESFFLPVYTSNTGLNSETQSTPGPEVNEMENETETTDNYNNQEGPSTSIAVSASTLSRNKSTEKIRRRPFPQDMAEQQMASAFSQLTDALSHTPLPPKEVKEDDECDLYTKLLAKKIRELPKDDRKFMMYEIDSLLIR